MWGQHHPALNQDVITRRLVPKIFLLTHSFEEEETLTF